MLQKGLFVNCHFPHLVRIPTKLVEETASENILSLESCEAECGAATAEQRRFGRYHHMTPARLLRFVTQAVPLLLLQLLLVVQLQLSF